jgi:hypothetical protein
MIHTQHVIRKQRQMLRAAMRERVARQAAPLWASIARREAGERLLEAWLQESEDAS